VAGTQSAYVRWSTIENALTSSKQRTSTTASCISTGREYHRLLVEELIVRRLLGSTSQKTPLQGPVISDNHKGGTTERVFGADTLGLFFSEVIDSTFVGFPTEMQIDPNLGTPQLWAHIDRKGCIINYGSPRLLGIQCRHQAATCICTFLGLKLRCPVKTIVMARCIDSPIKVDSRGSRLFPVSP
jgi:hypothetical protein